MKIIIHHHFKLEFTPNLLSDKSGEFIFIRPGIHRDKWEGHNIPGYMLNWRTIRAILRN